MCSSDMQLLTLIVTNLCSHSRWSTCGRCCSLGHTQLRGAILHQQLAQMGLLPKISCLPVGAQGAAVQRRALSHKPWLQNGVLPILHDFTHKIFSSMPLTCQVK